MHRHDFPGGRWRFDEPLNVAAVTTVGVLERRLPVLVVTHDEDDGGWQVLCGTTDRTEDGRVACLACLSALHPEIGELSDLPLGWKAWRPSPGAAWRRRRRAADPA